MSSTKKPRRVIIAGNWKMHKTRPEAKALAASICSGLGAIEHLPEVVLIPTFTSLAAVEEIIKDKPVQLGAQNMDYRDHGAFTGEISPPMLKELNVRYILVGHSERRQYFGETNQTTNLRVKAAFAHGLTPILCVGETLDERESDLTDAVVSRQVAAGLAQLDAHLLAELVIAYEPVWAIGTGKNCDAAEADRVAKLIRNTIKSLFTQHEPAVDADAVPVLYGGSVKAANIDEHLAAVHSLDGALVGGASLTAEDFLPIIQGGAKRLKMLSAGVVPSGSVG